MTLYRIGSVLALLAVICVLAVFFCHSIQGPYSAVHGPVTALLSVRAATGVRMAIVLATSNTPQFSLASPLMSFSLHDAALTALAPGGAWIGPDLTLRC